MNAKSLCIAVVCMLMMTVGQAQSIKNAIPDVARPLPLSAVRVSGGPLKRAQDLNAEYLLKLEPDRMMAYYRKRAGLEPKAPGYPGWDGDGRNLTGHIAGHYLSGTGDKRWLNLSHRFVYQGDHRRFRVKESRLDVAFRDFGKLFPEPVNCPKVTRIARDCKHQRYTDRDCVWHPINS